MQALPATASAVRRKPDGRREPAKRGPRPGGPVPLDPQGGGKKPDFTSKITIRRFLRRNPAFSDLIPARPSGRGGCLPRGFWFVKNAAFFRRGRRPQHPADTVRRAVRFRIGEEHTPFRRGGVCPARAAPPPLFRIGPGHSPVFSPLSTLHSSLSKRSSGRQGCACGRGVPRPYRGGNLRGHPGTERTGNTVRWAKLHAVQVFIAIPGINRIPHLRGGWGVGEPVRAKKACLFCFCCLQRSLF